MSNNILKIDLANEVIAFLFVGGLIALLWFDKISCNLNINPVFYWFTLGGTGLTSITKFIGGLIKTKSLW